MDFFDRFSPELLLGAGLGSLIIIIILAIIIRKLIKRKKPHKFRRQWRELQKKLADQSKWGEVIIEADGLLKDALCKKKLKGKTTGEMLVRAEKLFTDKDEIWFGHKLRKKIEANPKLKLDKKEVVRALVGLRQGIKDLGAFTEKPSYLKKGNKNAK